jgi:hypothetical protein
MPAARNALHGRQMQRALPLLEAPFVVGTALCVYFFGAL